MKAYLVELGVPGDRVVIVSKGKESPFCTESNESLLAAEPPRSLHHHGKVDDGKVAAIRSAASRGLGAAVMGRPITR